MPRIRIAFLVQYLSIGGIETRLLKLLRAIDLTRFDPVVLCGRDDGIQAESFKALGFPVFATPGLLPVSRAIQAAVLPKVLWLTRTARFDVVVSFLATSQPFEVWLARFACRRRGFLYALMNRDRQGVERYRQQRKALAERIVSVSRRTAEFYYPAEDDAWSKLTVIPNGVDLARFAPSNASIAAGRAALGLSADAILFAYPARIAPEKHHEVLLDVAKWVAERDSRVHFLLAGQDKRDGWLQAEIARRELDGTVTWVGPVHDPERLLVLCDGVILTSAGEGCPNALLEGMACGLPGVVTQSGAEEFVVEGETGFAVPIGDVEGLADRVLNLAANPDLRAGMGQAARAWMERHGTIERMLSDWFAVFDELGRASR